MYHVCLHLPLHRALMAVSTKVASREAGPAAGPHKITEQFPVPRFALAPDQYDGGAVGASRIITALLRPLLDSMQDNSTTTPQRYIQQHYNRHTLSD